MDERRVIRIMTYNIHHGRGLDGRVDIDRIAEVIRSGNPDIVGIQELDRRFGHRSLWTDQLECLTMKLGFSGAFAPTIKRMVSAFPYRLGYYGNAILSRYPIVRSCSELLPRQDTLENRGFLHAIIDVWGLKLNFIVTHLGLSERERVLQCSRLLDYLERVPAPRVLAGDFNEFPDGPTISEISARLRDAALVSEGGVRGLLPSRIDYIFVEDGLTVKAVERIRSDASDHDPIVAVVEIRRDRNSPMQVP